MEDQNKTPETTPQAADGTITFYCMGTKQKNCPMHDAVIDITAKGGYMAKGHDGKGNKGVSTLSKDKALAAIAAGTATKGAGWPEEA